MDEWKPLRVFIGGAAQEIAQFVAYWAAEVEALRKIAADPVAKQRLLRAVRAATGEPEPEPDPHHTTAKQKRWLFGAK